MPKLCQFVKTLSTTHFCFSSETVLTSSLLSYSSRFYRCLRSYKSTTTTGCSSDFSVTSSATNFLPPPMEDRFVTKLWNKCADVWTRALYTPFVVSLASGNLDLDIFRHYITQDVHFLRAFAKVYEMAEACSDDDDAKVGIREMRNIVLEELKMHDSYVKEWGVDPLKDSIPNAATVKCTDFLLATASGRIDGVKAPGKLATPFERTKLAAYTLGAVTPFMMLYAFLGKELQTFLSPGDDSHPYQKWIKSYSSKAYQASALQTEDLLEKLSVPLTGEELDVIEELYLQALKLELDFFLAQPFNQKAVVPLAKEHNLAGHRLMLFSDFDLTCTVLDSAAILAEIAILTALKSNQNPSTESEIHLAPMSSTDLWKTWSELSMQYTEEYEQCIEDILCCRKEENFNYEHLCGAIEKVSEFEKKANLRVIDSGVLKGLSLADIKRAGERLTLQHGCATFFQTAVANVNINPDIHILSYCWCTDLIRSTFPSGSFKIHANELVYENSLTTGEILKKVESPVDKVNAFTEILLNHPTDQKHLTVYIGDTVGDLLCLLKADVGIVFHSSVSLTRLGSHFGVSFVPLFPGVISKQKQYVEGSSDSWKSLSGVLYTVSSWAEIHAFILGS